MKRIITYSFSKDEKHAGKARKSLQEITKKKIDLYPTLFTE